MGSKERAERISKKFSNRAMQAVGYFIFNKCGNCVIRIPCIIEGTLKSGGYPDPLGKIIRDLSEGCPKHKTYKGHSVIARNVSKIAHEECNKCEKFELCVGNVLHQLGADTPELRDKMKTQLNKCVKCEQLDDCVQHYLDEFHLKSYTMFLDIFLTRFRRCKKEDMQIISIELEEMKRNSPKGINIDSSYLVSSSGTGDIGNEKPREQASDTKK